MDKTKLDPLAEYLKGSYLETFSFSRTFRDDHGQPPSLLAKIHYMLSVAQAMVTADGRYELSQAWVEFGRIEVTDQEDNRRYLLRSDGMVTIERGKRQGESLFDSNRYLSTGVTLLVHKFHKDGLDLSIAGTIQKDTGRGRLEISGAPVYVGTWPFGSDGPDGTGTFDQGGGDPFGDLGDMRDFGGGRL